MEKVNNIEEKEINTTIEKELKENNISYAIIKAVIKRGFEKLTDIQKKVIPIIMKGRDIVGKSVTGTGKTASFLIPIINEITKLEIRNRNPKSIIIVPTRELAIQINDEIKELSSYCAPKLRSIAIYGGGGKATISSQSFFLKKGIDIITGTPGRIIDHLERRNFDTSEIKFVVLDEADEMINIGFIDSMEEIIGKIKSNNYQKMLFSATLSQNISNFISKHLKNPDFIEVKVVEKNENENIEQNYVRINDFKDKKKKLLEILLEIKKNFDNYLIMIFVNTKKQAEFIQLFLNDNFDSMKQNQFIHGGLPQNKRERIIKNFKRKDGGGASILVTTNVSARGIHVDGITHVINYDLPQDDEFYIHRIGRTGRAGKKGKSITIICSYLEEKKLLEICKKNKFKINKQVINVSESKINKREY